MPVQFRDVSEKMLELGYEPIPSKRNKIPAIEGWRSVEVDKYQIAEWNANSLGNLNASTRLGREVREGVHLAILDCDILDTEGAKAMWDVVHSVTMGFFPGFRCGNEPKFAIPVLVKGEAKKKKSAIYRDKMGRDSAIEILNRGQQAVMFGELIALDGTTIKEYQWYRTDPLACPVDELPLLDNFSIHQVFDAFHHFAERHQWERKDSPKTNGAIRSKSSAAPRDVVAAMDNMRQPTATLLELEKLLRRIPPEISNDGWFRIIAGIHFETDGSADGLELADRWSSGGFCGVEPSNYKGRNDVEARYTSFKDSHVGSKTTVGTITAYAEQYSPHAPHEPVISVTDVDEDIPMSPSIAPTEDITESMPPLLKDIADYYKRSCTVVYSPMAAAMAALHVVSYATQRSFGLFREGDKIAKANLYHLQILPTGVGKASINSTIEKLLLHMMGEDRCQGIVRSIGSGQGLEDALLTHPNLLWLQDEIADKLLETNGPFKIGDKLKEYYSVSSEFTRQRTLVKTKTRTEIAPVWCPHLSVIGSSTPEKFASSVGYMDSVDGFLNRFIPIHTPKAELIMLPFIEGRTYNQIPASLTGWYDSLQMRMDFSDASSEGATARHPEVLQLPVEMARWMHAEAQRQVGEGGPTAALMVRRFENAMKVALILQLADDPESHTVTEDNWEWALRYIDHSITTMYNITSRGALDTAYVMQESEVFRRVKELLAEPSLANISLTESQRKLANAGVLTLTWLRRFISRSSRLDRELTSVLQILQTTGEVGHFTGAQLKERLKLPIGNRLMNEPFYFLQRNQNAVVRNLEELALSYI